MRKYETIPFTTNREVLTQVRCNKCGADIPLSDYWDETHAHFDIDFGYGSPYDGDTWSFDLCYNCLNELVESFVIEHSVKTIW